LELTERENPLIIFGCGGHARSVADVALHSGIKHLVFVDKQAKVNEKLFGFDVVKSIDDSSSIPTIVAIGDNHERAKIYNELVIKNRRVIALISTTAYRGKNTHLDAGVFVAHAAHIGPNTRIGSATLINTRCIIEHDCLIGSYSHVAVNAVVAGRSQIGDYVMIGAGATVIDQLHICSHVIIGAGAVVVTDITEPGIYTGVPAKIKSSYK
jgi:UDP-N-acetylbacillosamine N-acetyltransferase